MEDRMGKKSDRKRTLMKKVNAHHTILNATFCAALVFFGTILSLCTA